MQTKKSLIFLIVVCSFFISCSKKEVEIKGDIFIVTQSAENYKMGLVQVTAFPEETIKSFIESKNSNNESQVLVEYDKAEKELSYAEKNALEVETSYRNKMNSIKNTIDGGNASVSELQQALADIKNWDESPVKDAKIRALNAKFKFNEVSDRLKRASSGQKYFVDLPAGIATAISDADGKFTLTLPKTGKYALVAQAERKVLDKTEKYYWLITVNADSESKSIMLSNNNLSDSNSPDSLINPF